MHQSLKVDGMEKKWVITIGVGNSSLATSGL